MNAVNAVPTSVFSGQFYNAALQNVVDLRSPQSRITMNDSACGWSGWLNKRLEELIRLPLGWDGYAGRPVSFETAVFTLRMLERLYSDGVPMPILVPGYTGDVQAEWHIAGHDIELHVVNPNRVQAWRASPGLGEDGEELSLTNDFTKLGAWIQELAEAADAIATAAA